MNITADTCRSVLAEHGLLPHDRRAVYLGGSLARGWGNDTSDVDVYIVTDSPWSGAATTTLPISAEPGTVPIKVFYVGNRRWDVEFWLDRQVDELLSATVSWEAFNSVRPAGDTLGSTETAFIQRLTFSEVAEGEAWVQLRREQFDNSAVRTIVAANALYMVDHYTEDAVGMTANGDLESAVLAARLAFGFAVDALLASCGEIEDKPKWRARRMRAVAPSMLSFDVYWGFETMRFYNEDEPEKWVEEALRVCQRIAESIEL